MSPKRFLTSIAGVTSALLLTCTVGATSLERYSLTELAQQSELGVIGEVTSSQGTFSEGRFYTIVTVQIDETLFGDQGTSVQVRYPGGSATVNGVRVGENVAAATPRLEGMKAVYFLSAASEDGTRDIVGFTQGQLDIVERDGEDLIASPDQASLLSVNDFSVRVRALRDAQ